MQNLFNNEAYPLVSNKEQAIAALRADVTRATSIRHSSWVERAKLINLGITIGSDEALAARYNAPKTADNKKMTGQKGYTAPFTYDDIKNEAQENGLIITEQALELLHEHTTEVRGEFVDIQTNMLGHDQFETTGRLLFAPKGAIGRAPIMHVDDVYLTLHETFKGAKLRVHSEKGTAFNDTVWDMLDRRKTSKKETENNDAKTQRLMAATRDFNDEFSDTVIGDVVIMHGQKDRDLSDPAERDKVCVHSSSQMIPVFGQVAISFFSRPLPSNDL